jgi:hypothetical protein
MLEPNFLLHSIHAFKLLGSMKVVSKKTLRRPYFPGGERGIRAPDRLITYTRDACYSQYFWSRFLMKKRTLVWFTFKKNLVFY